MTAHVCMQSAAHSFQNKSAPALEAFECLVQSGSFLFAGLLQPEKQFFRHRGMRAPLTVATLLKGTGVVCEEVAEALSHLTK